MKIQIENLKAQMQGRKLNIYQRADALTEFNKLLDYVEELEQLTIPDVVKSLKGVDKISLIEWREKTFREIGTNRFELRTNTALVYGMDEISKMYDSF